MYQFKQQGGIQLLIVVLIIGLAVLMSGGIAVLPKVPLKKPTPTPVYARIDTQSLNVQSAKKDLQVNSLPMITLTPSTSPTPTPITPSPTSTIDYSSGTLDWEDVEIMVRDACRLSTNPDLKSLFCQFQINWECDTLSNTCANELHNASNVELGGFDVSVAAPQSRTGLCLNDPSCRQFGFDHYRGSIPLPTYAPSKQCQDEIRACYEKSPSRAKLGSLDPRVLTDPLNPNCDPSDKICPP